MEDQEYLRLREEYILQAVRDIAPSGFDPVIKGSEKMIALVGRKGGKSSILRIKNSNGDLHPQYVVKAYNPGVKTISGREVHKEQYATERAVLESIKGEPPTYVEALRFNDEFLFFVLPFITDSTLEEKIYRGELKPEMLWNAVKLIKTAHLVLNRNESKIENKLNETLDNIQNISSQGSLVQKISSIMGLHGSPRGILEPRKEDYITDMLRYNEVFKENGKEAVLNSKQIDNIARGLRDPKYIGIGPMDGYPWSMTEKYLFDAGAVKRCSNALHLGCLLGNHLIYRQTDTGTLNQLLEMYVAGQGNSQSQNREKMEHFKKFAFIPSSIYANYKDIAGTLKVQRISRAAQRDIKGYVSRGLKCIKKQLSEMEANK